MIVIGKTTYQTPYMNLLPPLTEEEANTLKEDIEQRGIVVPVVIDDQYNVIDGHNRLRIAAELGLLDIPFDIRVGLSEAEKSQLAQDLNLHRRHLDKEKRQAMAVRLRQGGLSYPEIASQLNIGVGTAYRDIATFPHGKVEQPDKITGKDGKERPATMPRTSIIARNSKEVNQAIRTLEQVTNLPEMAMTMPDMRQEARKAKIRDREANGELNPGAYKIDGCNVVIGDAKAMDLSRFPEKFGVIVADPPWPYQQFSERKHGAARSSYDLMTMNDLYAMPIPELAAKNAILFLWGTWPKLVEATALIQAWGFEYITGFPWIKTDQSGQPYYGVGFWVRGCSEYVLVARRGDVPPPRLEGFLGLIGPGMEHSRKPESVHQIAEALPGPYLELFARRPKHGWTVFGNDPGLAQKVFA